MKSAAGEKVDPLTLSGEIQKQRALSAESLKLGMAERRVKSRVSYPFPGRVWGTDGAGQTFEDDCVLDNLSSTGLYVRLPRQMKSGAELNLVIRFLEDGATAYLLGQVLRNEPQPDGRYGIAIAIKDHHFV